MAQKLNDRDISPVINAVKKWIADCLICDGSIFSAGSLWVAENIEEVKKAFVDNPDEGEDSFSTKLQKQMQEASPAARHLMSEMLWVILTFPTNIGQTKKREHIREAWNFSKDILPADHAMLSDEVLSGIGSAGQAFNTLRWLELSFLIALAGDLKKRTKQEREKILLNYDNFVEWIKGFPKGEKRQFKQILRYFAFPDRVERVSTNRHRQAILAKFGNTPENVTKKWTDPQLDDALLKLRDKLQIEHPDKILDFFESPLREMWDLDLAEPFSDIFESRPEAEWAFEFIKKTLDQLNVKSPEDTRVALTLPIDENFIRLNYGQWVVASFFGEKEAPNRAEITLLAGLVDLTKKGTFTTKPNEPESCVYGIPIEKLRDMEPKLRSALDKSLEFIASRFRDQEKSGYRKSHQPKLMEMIFDNEKRAQYLTEGFRPKSDASYWKIAPGDDAWQWADCQKDKFIAVGWDDFGDLSGIDHSEFDRRFDKLLPENPNWTKQGCEQLWKFFQIKEGDRIVANRGTTEVLGIGTVTGPYYFVPGLDFGHRLPVKWDDVRPRKVEKGGWKRTLISLSEETFNEIMNALSASAPIIPKPVANNASNTILYGPPGTGKTYKTIERAVQIIEPGFTGDHAAHKSRFDALRANGQIEFITFHQSYSYEDFVEGLRPVIEGPESSEAAYEYSSGVFKRFAFQALFDCLKPSTGIVSFDAVWKKLVEQTELEPDKLYPGLSEKTSYRISLSTKGNLDGINTISNKTFLCSRSVLEKVFVAKPENDKVTSSEVMEVVVRGCHSHFVAAMFNELKRVEKSEFAGKRPSQTANISSEQKAAIAQAFLEKNDTGTDAFKPVNEWPQYVLVIDEINRGNISKILGELITLIEPDKRLGAEISLVVTLPYTKHSFGVPGNLHLLGTMNTADKSIALVDVALRRRFQFEELRPNFNHCQQLTQPMRDVLDSLNRRICLRKDRDHQIGHSYFIKVENEAGFNRIFARHVIPLLQEYFYNDWDGLRFVLGVKNKDNKLIIPLKDGDSGDSRSSWQWGFELGDNNVNFLQILAGKDLTS